MVQKGRVLFFCYQKLVIEKNRIKSVLGINSTRDVVNEQWRIQKVVVGGPVNTTVLKKKII